MASQSSEVEETGFTYEIRDDGIVVYHLTDLRRDSVDQFIEVSHNFDVQAFEEGRHSRCMLDISKLKFPTPYAAKRIQQNSEATPDGLLESYAVVTPTSAIYTFARTILNHLPNAQAQSIRLFHDEASAIEWLQARLEQLGP